MTSSNKQDMLNGIADKIQKIADDKQGRNEDLMWETFASILRRGEPIPQQMKVVTGMINMKMSQLSALVALHTGLAEIEASCSPTMELFKEILSRKIKDAE